MHLETEEEPTQGVSWHSSPRQICAMFLDTPMRGVTGPLGQELLYPVFLGHFAPPGPPPPSFAVGGLTVPLHLQPTVPRV